MLVAAAMIIAAPCSASAPIDEGQAAPCSGFIISTERAKEAISCKRELNLRKTFECDPCPACPNPQKDETVAIATASFFSGFVLGLLLLVIR